MFVGDVTGAAGVRDFVSQQIFELFFRYTVESIGNTIRAFLWPLYLIGFRPPAGMIALAVMYVLFPLTLKKPVERLLFDGELDGAATAGDQTGPGQE